MKKEELKGEVQKFKDTPNSTKGNKAMTMLNAENEALKKEMVDMQAAIDGKHAKIT